MVWWVSEAAIEFDANLVKIEEIKQIFKRNVCYYRLETTCEIWTVTKAFISVCKCEGEYRFIYVLKIWRQLSMMQQPWEYSRENSYVRYSVQFELAIISATDPTVSCMKSLGTCYRLL